VLVEATFTDVVVRLALVSLPVEDLVHLIADSNLLVNCCHWYVGVDIRI